MFESQEESITDCAGQLHGPGDASGNRFLATFGLGSDTLMPQKSLQLASIFSYRVKLCDTIFSKALQSNVRIASNATTPEITGDNYGWICIGSNVTGQRIYKLSPDNLTRNWECTLETAQRTLDVTTKRGIRTVANTSLSRQFWTNDRQLRYKWLEVNMFTDTLESSVQLKRGNRYVQVYCTHFGRTREYGMPTKVIAQEMLFNF